MIGDFGPPLPGAATVDRCHRLMRRLGWTVGESASRTPDGSVLWHVAATRQRHTIFAWAATQPAAWESVCRMAGRAEKTGQTTPPHENCPSHPTPRVRLTPILPGSHGL
jgi:hypothetical protein